MQLGNRQAEREYFVRSCLEGRPPPPKVNHTETLYTKTQLSSDIETRIRRLKAEIKQVRKERKKVLQNGQSAVKNYMEQIKKEQEAHSKKMQEYREMKDASKSKFIEQVTEIETSFNSQKCPSGEIEEKVRAALQKTDIGKGRTISSIQYTEVQPDSDTESFD